TRHHQGRERARVRRPESRSGESVRSGPGHEVLEGTRRPQDSSPQPGCGFRGGCDRPGGGRERWNGTVFVQFAAGFGSGPGTGVLSLEGRGSRSGAAGEVSQAVSVLLSGSQDDDRFANSRRDAGATEDKSKWRKKNLSGISRTAT